MEGGTAKTIINSWNEWDPLKHVIVGRADGGMIQAPEPGMVFGKPGEGFEAGEWGSRRPSDTA